MTKKLLKVPSLIKKIETLVDRSLKLTVYTQELSPEDKTTLFELLDKPGWFLFSEAQIEPEDLVDLPKIKPSFKSEKTPSERLRAVIYIYWKQKGGEKTGKKFDDYYRDYIEQIIDRIKEKLN